MKNILIVVPPTTDWNRDICSTMQTEALKYKESVQVIVDTAFLISGPKSFEIATSLFHIASKHNIPVAVFEIENVLSIPNSVS